MDRLRIGQVARLSGLSIDTIRFYERRGLIEEPPRAASGYREYPRGVVRRLRFVRRAKELGFSLAEIEELLALSYDAEASTADVRARAEAKIADLSGRIADLEKMRAILVELTRACSASGPEEACPILSALLTTGA